MKRLDEALVDDWPTEMKISTTNACPSGRMKLRAAYSFVISSGLTQKHQTYVPKFSIPPKSVKISNSRKPSFPNR
jgi:hypothetical protein